MISQTETQVYDLKTDSGQWLAEIVITSTGALLIVSDWGNFNICWRAYKNLNSFKEFLQSINPAYFAGNAIRSNNFVYGNTKKADAAASRFALNVFVPFQKLLIKESEGKND